MKGAAIMTRTADAETTETMTVETICPLCSNGCPLDNPMCGRGETYARSLGIETVHGASDESHEGGRAHEGAHAHGAPHGHAHGNPHAHGPHGGHHGSMHRHGRGGSRA